MNDIRILMCGSRNWFTRGPIFEELTHLIVKYQDRLVIIHGDEPRGADNIIHMICKGLGTRHEMYCAAKPRHKGNERFKIEQVSDWKIDGLSAGPKRNRYMLDTGITGVVAFRSDGKSNGTDGMCKLALDVGKPVKLFTPNGSSWLAETTPAVSRN